MRRLYKELFGVMLGIALAAPAGFAAPQQTQPTAPPPPPAQTQQPPAASAPAAAPPAQDQSASSRRPDHEGRQGRIR